MSQKEPKQTSINNSKTRYASISSIIQLDNYLNKKLGFQQQQKKNRLKKYQQQQKQTDTKSIRELNEKVLENNVCTSKLQYMKYLQCYTSQIREFKMESEYRVLLWDILLTFDANSIEKEECVTEIRKKMTALVALTFFEMDPEVNFQNLSEIWTVIYPDNKLSNNCCNLVMEASIPSEIKSDVSTDINEEKDVEINSQKTDLTQQKLEILSKKSSDSVQSQTNDTLLKKRSFEDDIHSIMNASECQELSQCTVLVGQNSQKKLKLVGSPSYDLESCSNTNFTQIQNKTPEKPDIKTVSSIVINSKIIDNNINQDMSIQTKQIFINPPKKTKSIGFKLCKNRIIQQQKPQQISNQQQQIIIQTPVLAINNINNNNTNNAIFNNNNNILQQQQDFNNNLQLINFQIQQMQQQNQQQQQLFQIQQQYPQQQQFLPQQQQMIPVNQQQQIQPIFNNNTNNYGLNQLSNMQDLVNNNPLQQQMFSAIPNVVLQPCNLNFN